MNKRAWLVAVVAVGLVVTLQRTYGDMSGDRGRPIVMQGVVAGEGGQDRARLSIEVERIGFLLNTVQGKYRMVRLRFENLATSPVALSVARDRLEVETAAGPVAAVLNLQTGDSAFWDALSPDLRQVLAYPQSVKARPTGPGTSAEVIYLYALFPSDRVTEVPRAFTYRVDSLGQPIRIEHRATAALP